MTTIGATLNPDPLHDSMLNIFSSEKNGCICCSESYEGGTIMNNNGINVNSEMIKAQELQQPMIHNPFRPALGLSSLFLQPPLTMMTETSNL